MFKTDEGTIVLFIFLAILLVCTFAFPFIKMNGFFGIRLKKTFESEELWHKTHVFAAVFTIPSDIALILCLFLNGATEKIFLGFIIVNIQIFIYYLTAHFVTKNYFKNKKIQEQKELEEQIKKESGWR